MAGNALPVCLRIVIPASTTTGIFAGKRKSATGTPYALMVPGTRGGSASYHKRWERANAPGVAPLVARLSGGPPAPGNGGSSGDNACICCEEPNGQESETRQQSCLLNFVALWRKSGI